MSDQFPIIAPQVTASAGVVSDYVINLAFNQLTLAVRTALNTLAGSSFPPSGPAGGDLSGTYPNPTVLKVHATSGTLDNVVVGGVVPAAGTFTTLSASSLTLTSALSIANGGTGQITQPAALTALLGASLIPIANGGTNASTAANARTNLGLGTIATQNASAVTITGGTVDGTAVGATTPNTGAFTTLSASGTVSGAGVTARFSSPGPIGNTAASTGNFTTVAATGTITPSSTNGIVGTTTNDNANAGSVGELLTNTTNATSLTTATPANGTSVSLTAGDWEVSGTVRFNPAGTTTVSAIIVGLNNVSATFNAALGMVNQLQTTFTTGQTQLISTPVIRFSLASTTTVFLVVQSNFATSTMTADGFIRARRVR